MTVSLQSLFDRTQGRRLVLVGDIVADHYIEGDTSRISREAPVLILKYRGEKVIPGQAGNTAANIASLGGVASVVSCVGDDSRGRMLVEALEAAAIDTHGIVVQNGSCTVTKTRILAGGRHTCKQQVIRIDDDERQAVKPEAALEMLERLPAAVGKADAVIVSDYGYGTITDAVWEACIRLTRQRGIPLALDSRYDLPRRRGATIITPNESEALEASRITSPNDIDLVGRRLLEITEAENVLVTRGNEGMALFQKNQPPIYIPIFGSDQVADVTGAGDTVVATVSLMMAAGATAEQAARVANLAGGIVVMKMGTATVSREEITQSISRSGL